MKKTEIVIIASCLLAVILNFALVPGGILLTILSFTLLSVIYFNLGFLLFNNIRLRNAFKSESYKGIKSSRMIGAIGTGFALSLIVIGVLFKLLSWPGSAVVILVGVFFTGVVVLISTIKYLTSKNPFYMPVLIRAGGLLIIGGSLMFVSSGDIMDFKYRNHPTYYQALKAWQADPDNTELREKMEEETSKLDK